MMPRRRLHGACGIACVVAAVALSGSAAGRKFFDDDPLSREPETQNAAGAQPWDIDLFYDLGYNLFVTPRRPVADVRAQNVNTIDEVPDSSWFTNRIGSRELTVDEVVRGPVVGPAPVPSTWTLTREKSSGFSPGFTARDAKGETWFLSFDPPSNPEAATAAIVVANKIFWALGYNQAESFVTEVRAKAVVIADNATTRRPSGARSRFERDDLAEVLGRAARHPDGSYRVAAARLLPGKVLGGFRYESTRPDDPNDVVPHEHRRELRALRVFGAWTNLTDMKAGNTLDTLIEENGRSVIRHYLQDVGSTFGIGANGPHEWDDGWEYAYDGGGTRKRLFTLGFGFSRWQTADYDVYPSIGRFEGDAFDPERWKPHAPTAAYLHMRADDAFWAAERVMAFSDPLIRAVVRTGAFSDPKAEQHLGDVLIARRDKIGRAYLPAINPIVNPTLDAAGSLRVGNAAVRHGLATAPRGYTAAWHTFDNATGQASALAVTTSQSEQLTAPASVPSAPGTFIRVDLSADHADHPSWKRPVRAYFTRQANAWRLVGFERLPDDQ